MTEPKRKPRVADAYLGLRLDELRQFNRLAPCLMLLLRRWIVDKRPEGRKKELTDERRAFQDSTRFD